MNRLDGKTAIIHGVDTISDGIAWRFQSEGAAIGIIDRDKDRAQALCHGLSGTGGRAYFSVVDSNAEICGATDELFRQLGGVHVLVNNTLPTPFCASLEEQSEAVFEQALGAVQAAASAMQAVFPYMRNQQWGRIVNIGHRYGEGANDYIGAYNSAAWAMIGLTRTAAVDWGQFQIATNVLLPLADTPEYRSYHERRATLLDLLVSQLPLQRVGDPQQDVGAAAAYLACDEVNFVNGQVFNGDGGQHIAGPVLNPGKFR